MNALYLGNNTLEIKDTIKVTKNILFDRRHLGKSIICYEFILCAVFPNHTNKNILLVYERKVTGVSDMWRCEPFSDKAIISQGPTSGHAMSYCAKKQNKPKVKLLRRPNKVISNTKWFFFVVAKVA